MSLKCYIVNSDELNDPVLFNEVIDTISFDRRTKALSYCFEKDRKLSAVAGLFFRTVEVKYNVRITIDEDDKPQTNRSDVNFNVSHSGSMVVCAVSDVPVGIDVEAIGNNLDISKDVMMKEEYEIFMSMDNREEVFCRMWTIKESYMKALGKGLSIPPNTFDIIKENGLRHDGFPNGLKVRELESPEGYCVSVCSSDVECDEMKAISCRQMLDLIRL